MVLAPPLMKKKGLATKWRGSNGVIASVVPGDTSNIESSILVLKTHEESIAELERPDLAAARREETRRRRLRRVAAAPPRSSPSAADEGSRKNKLLLLSKAAETGPSGSDATLATEASASSSAGFGDEVDDDEEGGGALAEFSASDEFPGSNNGSADPSDADEGAGPDRERGDEAGAMATGGDHATPRDVGAPPGGGPRPSVTFSTVTIRSHPIELGDNPSVSRGPPVTISWRHDPERSATLSIDEYEDSHPPRRAGEEMVLPRTRREIMLKEAGVGRGEMKEAARSAEREMRRRMKSARGYERAARIHSVVSVLKVWRWGY